MGLECGQQKNMKCDKCGLDRDEIGRLITIIQQMIEISYRLYPEEE